jgi:hypothetical protein
MSCVKRFFIAELFPVGFFPAELLLERLLSEELFRRSSSRRTYRGVSTSQTSGSGWPRP